MNFDIFRQYVTGQGSNFRNFGSRWTYQFRPKPQAVGGVCRTAFRRSLSEV